MPSRWTVLVVGTAAQAATCSFLYGVPMLIPALTQQDHLSLPAAGVLSSAPIAGLLVTLILWGAAADRSGERGVITVGVGLAGLLLALVPLVPGVAMTALLLALAGAAGASVNAASGRLVMGWFPRAERGFAMGARQTAQPLGVALAALTLPPLAATYGPRAALLFPAAACVLAAAAVWFMVRDPARTNPGAAAAAPRSPYRGSAVLPRVHLASALLVVPQFAVASFTLAYLAGERHWDPSTAGRWIVAFQVAGAAGRVASGVWSDRVGSRLRPMRQLAVASVAVMLGLAAGAWAHTGQIVLAFAVGAVVTVADNGLAYTAVAELAGGAWAGRALGVQNTVQNVAAVATAPALAAAIAAAGYPVAFAVVAAAPALAIVVTPVRREGAAQWPAAGCENSSECGGARSIPSGLSR
jgi:sugar phosphate permease